MIFWRFFKAWIIYQWAKVAGYETIASPQTQRIRQAICETCKFYDEGMCNVCGCLTLSKQILAMEKCPLDKWLREWRRDVTV